MLEALAAVAVVAAERRRGDRQGRAATNGRDLGPGTVSPSAPPSTPTRRSRLGHLITPAEPSPPQEWWTSST
ncbi:hypothetical protein ACFQYP_15220 [Nonomuraea antimicrobica]